MAVDTLTDLQRSILAIEAQFWKTAGAKEDEIRSVLGLSATRYYQVLNQLLGCEAALAYDPVTVKRLRRIARR